MRALNASDVCELMDTNGELLASGLDLVTSAGERASVATMVMAAGTPQRVAQRLTEGRLSDCRMRRSGRPWRGCAKPPASCTAVVEAPRRASSVARPRRPECDDTPSRPSASGRAWMRRLTWCGSSGTTRSAEAGIVATRRSSSTAQAKRADQQAQVLASACGVGLRGPHANPQSARRAPPA